LAISPRHGRVPYHLVRVRQDERRARVRTGIVVVVAAAVMFVVLFIVGQARGIFSSKTDVFADFVTTSGLREGSPVQLAGVRIGIVSGIDYVDVRYACDPLTEDIGRYGAGRTDNCDKRMFCASEGLCADLEPTADDHMYGSCVDDLGCGVQEVCITNALRDRAPRVLWLGPSGVCGRYSTLHHRVRVEMTIEAERLSLIRRDSVASLSANSVLGDQLINITPGIGDAMGEHERVLSSPSLSEDIELYRLRLERVIEHVDVALSAITGLVRELADPRTLEAIRLLATNLQQITEAVAKQRGIVGALIGEPEYRRNFGIVLHALGSTAGGVNRFVGTGNSILDTADKNLEPLLADVSATLEQLRTLIVELRDPANKSVVAKLIDDPEGKLVADLESILAQTEQITDAVAGITGALESEKGTLGKVIGDPKLADDLGRLLDNLQSNEALTGLLLWALEQNDIGVKASRNPAAPPRSRGR
jgi:ABC-type transporter Mla subunit MlaD